MLPGRDTTNGKIISFSRVRARVLLAGFDPFARRAIEDPSLEMIPPRGEDLFFEAFDVAAFDARQDPAAALQLLESLRAESAAPAVLLVSRTDDATAESARTMGANVLRAPFTAEDVRRTLISLVRT